MLSNAIRLRVLYLEVATQQQPCKCQLSNFLSAIGVAETSFRRRRILYPPATTFSTSTNATEETNLTVLSSETDKNVDERIQETAFNDAGLVSNQESSTPDTRISRFDDITSIIQFLERPALLWQSRLDSSMPTLQNIESFTTPSITQTPIKTFMFPSDLMKVGSKMEKIANYEWFKADVLLRILINANPFIAGRLWITYSPIDSSPNASSIQDYAKIDKKGRVGITSYPGVELDLQTNTAAEILVPWISENDAEQASIDNQQLYRVDIWALTPLLLADNSLKIPIQIYGSFRNVQLKAPTPIYRSATRQAKEARGPITEISGQVGSIASKLKNLPVVGGVASTVEWASNMVSGVASVFGWSRPIEGSNAEPFAHIPGRGMAHFKAKDSAVVLGMANDNSIAEKHQNFISDVDEMTIEHICSRPGLVDVITWETSDDFNDSLGSYLASRHVHDRSIIAVGTGDDRTEYLTYDPTLAEYTLNQFHFYRADWVFRISLVKTAFHVGRFEVFFVPNNVVGQRDIKAIDSTNCYRQIFDITEQNEMTFTVPYVQRKIMIADDYNAENYGDIVGQLVIRVVSPLTCPDTVSQNIKILVWKHAENAAVAYPHPSGIDPMLAQNIKASYKSAERQINVTNEPKGTNYVVFDRDNSLEDNMDAATVVAGENCISLRQATRSFRENRYKITLAESTVPNVLDYYVSGYIGVCANIFYFYRGGISHKLLDVQNKGIISRIVTYGYNKLLESSFNAPFHITIPGNQVHEVSLPYYSTSRRQVCSKAVSFVDIEMPALQLNRLDGTKIDSQQEIVVYTAAKDDLTFGFLVGAPVLARKRPSS